MYILRAWLHIYHIHIIMLLLYMLQCIYFVIYYTVYYVCTMYIICTLYNIHFISNNVIYILYTIQHYTTLYI